MIIDLNTLCAHIKKENVQLVTDSRQVKNKDVFIALPAAQSSHLGKKLPPFAYIETAISQKASHIVLDKELYARIEKENKIHNNIYYIPVEDTRFALGILAQTKYDTKDLPFPIIALTGTNGKTTSSYLLEHLYTACHKKVAVLGTVSYHWEGHYEDAPLTTPDCLHIHKALAEMRKVNVDVVLMEISSHALDQNRIAGLEFSGALFTNLTQDHLDYHENMENYYNAKSSLFTSVPKLDKAMSVFGADPFGKRIRKCETSIRSKLFRLIVPRVCFVKSNKAKYRYSGSYSI
jgi:UDP-N-acetylmuramoyl-L-alanyl-D-glutamate--2,6-diaminopimelate ligase